MATLLNSLLTRLEVYKFINQYFKKLYYPLIIIAYLYNPIIYNEMPIEVTNKQIKSVGGWLLKHYKND